MHISGIIKTIKVIVTERKGYTDRKGREYKRKRRVCACILPPSSFVTKGGFFMGNNFAIKNYLDADKVTKELDALIKKPIYSIKPEALKKYEREYYAKKCAK